MYFTNFQVDNSAENENCVTNDIEPNVCVSSESSDNQGLHSEQVKKFLQTFTVIGILF